jgi:type IV pilus assembly protein PilC
MASFTYSALNEKGVEVRGHVQAADAKSALGQLRQQALFAVEIQGDSAEEGGSGLNAEVDLSALKRLIPISNQDVVFFFRQLSFMTRAGLPVLQSLQLARTQVSNPNMADVIEQMVLDIRGGLPLSRALGKHPKVFPPFVQNLAVAGESTGEMDVIMERLATHLEKKGLVKSQMVNAMIYPAIVVLATIGVVTFLVFKIIPKFGDFLKSQGKPLPASTQFLLDLADFIQIYWPFMLGGAALVFFGIVAVYRSPGGRFWIDGVLLRVPVIGKVLTTGAMAQLTWALSMVLRSGVTIMDGLKITANTIGNQVISSKLERAAEQVLAGRELSSSLKHPAIPLLVVQMITVGERTGTLDQVLEELGTYFEQRLELSIKRLGALVEPAMLLVIGGIVGFVYYAFFQAMFSLAGN